MSVAPDPLADGYMLQWLEVAAFGATDPSYSLWTVPIGWRGRVRALNFTVNYMTMVPPTEEKPTYFEVQAPDGTVFLQAVAGQAVQGAHITTLGGVQKNMATGIGAFYYVYSDDAADVRTVASLPDTWWPEQFAFVLRLNSDSALDFINSVNCLVEGMLAADTSALTDVVPPYTAQTPSLQTSEVPVAA